MENGQKIRPDLKNMVALDGNRVRLLREKAQLTQLYVAKVVGVTTDTISRWENNRYPSIKRSNATRLAEALEVDLVALLKSTGSEVLATEENGFEQQQAQTRNRLFLLAVLVSVLVVGAAALFMISHQKPTIQSVVGKRSLAPFAAPNGLFPVIVELHQSLVGQGIILREHFPAGWKLIEAVPPASSLDNLEGMARWIIKPGEGNGRVVYLLRVDRAAEKGTLAKFQGEVVLRGDGGSAPALVGGISGAKVHTHIWADQNGDDVVDDVEMLSASDTVDLMQGVHLDWNLLEKIWDAGGYTWDAETYSFLPKHP